MTISSNHQYWSLAEHSPYWLTEYPSGNFTNFYSGDIDSSQNSYFASGVANGPSPTDNTVVKSNIAGYPQWIANCSGSSSSVYPVGSVAVGSDGNIYTGGGQKINSTTGAAEWAYTYTINGNVVLSSNAAIEAYGSLTGIVSTGPSTQTIVAGSYRAVSLGTPPAYLFKNAFVINQNTAGIVQWVKQLSDTTHLDVQSTAMDTNSNVYVGGNFSGSPQIAYLIQLDSTGTVAWRKQFSSSVSGQGTDFVGSGDTCIVCDSNNNVYVAVYDEASTAQNTTVLKFNGAGVLQWQRKIDDSGANHFILPNSLRVDSNGNVYLCALWQTPQDSVLVCSWDTNGVFQWQNSIDDYTGASQIEPGVVLAVPGLNDIMVSVSGFTETAGTSSFYMRVPNDGHLLFYKNLIDGLIQYQNQFLTESAGSLTVGSPGTPTVTSPGYTQTAQTFTTGNVGLTNTRIAMP